MSAECFGQASSVGSPCQIKRPRPPTESQDHSDPNSSKKKILGCASRSLHGRDIRTMLGQPRLGL